MSLPSTTLKLLHNIQPPVFGLLPASGIVHSSKFATGTSPMTSPIIQPGCLTFGQPPPSAKERVHRGENIGVDLDQISTTIADKLKIGIKSMDNTKAKKIDTSKISPISDVKVSQEKSRDVDVKAENQSQFGKIKLRLSNRSCKLRQKLRSSIIIPKAYQEKKPSQPEGGNACVLDNKVSMEKEQEGGMNKHEDQTSGNGKILSEEHKEEKMCDTTQNMVQRKSVSEVISESNLFSNTECGNGVLSSSKELNGDSGFTIPSDLDSLSPIPFNLDQTLPESYLNSDGTTRSKCDNILLEAQQQKCDMDMSKGDEANRDVIINVDSPSVPCRSKNISSQSAHKQSVILIESSQEDIPDIATDIEATNKQSVPLKRSAGEINSAGIKYIPLAGNPDTVFVNFPSHSPSLDHTYGSKLVEGNNEVSRNLKENSKKLSMNDKNQEKEIPKLIPDYDSESDNASAPEQSSPVFGTCHEQGKKKLSMNFMETFMQPMPAAQKFLLDPKGLLQSEVSMKELDGNSLKSGSMCYPKTSTPDLDQTAMTENTSSDVTTSNSEPSSITSQQTSS